MATDLEASIAAWMDRDGDTRVLWAVLTQPARQWWAATRTRLTKPPAATPCQATRRDGDFTWRCHLTTHPGPHRDLAYGVFLT